MISHPWDVTPAEAVRVQRELAESVVIGGMPDPVRTVAGIDIALGRADARGYCGIIAFSYPELVIVDRAFAEGAIGFPYVPGLLSFREGPLILAALAQLAIRPDLLVFDGQGIAHPRRLGIAAHLGLVTGIPSIGCAKSRLYGAYTEPPAERGARSYLVDPSGAPIGVTLRTRTGVRPVFVSPGHRIGVDEAADFMMSCVSSYRVPTPTRVAHIEVGAFKARRLLDAERL